MAQVSRAEVLVKDEKPSGGEPDISAYEAYQSDERDRLITSHLPLARRLARSHWSRTEPLEDLEQVASIGLVKAADNFDRERGLPFAAYAIPKIRGELWRYLRDYPGLIRIPRPLQELQGRLRKLGQQPVPDGSDSWDVPLLAARLGVEETTVREALFADLIRFPYSLERRIGAHEASLHEYLSLPGSEIEEWEQRETVHALLAHLSDRERLVIYLTVLAGMSQRQAAKVVGISQMHVSRLRTSAIGRLRGELKHLAA